MKKLSVFLSGLFFLLLWTGAANADLITIGTAQFNGTGTEYNLIYDADSPFGPITWLDYSNIRDSWENQKAWAAGLNGILTYNTPGYTVNWDNSNWRLPSTVNGSYMWDYDGNERAAYNITNSEMGHLYYIELENLGRVAIDGSYPQPGWGLTNTGDFENLIGDWYWSGTSGTENFIYTYGAWLFNMGNGSQFGTHKADPKRGLAVISGQVSTAPIPAPSTIFLLGSGLLGIVGLSRRKN